MSIPKGYVEEILGLSFRARQKEITDRPNPFANPIIHRQIRGDRIYKPLNRSLWNQ